MIQSREELQELVYLMLGESGQLLKGDFVDDSEHEVGLAVSAAIRELGLTFPLQSNTLEFWAVERGKRHSFDIIRTSSARKFRYKQVHMQQRFVHFNVLIEKMDADFIYALETNAELMSLVGGLRGDNFITYIKAGFVYNMWGQDVSHKLE